MVRISDLELLKLLVENSRRPYVELAKHFGVSETAIRKRIKKLEKSGAIRKYTIDIDPKKVGFEIDVLIGIDTKPESYIRVLKKLKGMEEIRTLRTSTGDHMILLECWFRNSDELSEFIAKLEWEEGIIKICPAIILERIK